MTRRPVSVPNTNSTKEMNNSTIDIHSTATCGLVGAVALALAAVTPTAEAFGWPRAMVSTGDSLSDTGNFFALTGGTQPPPPYFEGRFCDGPVWNEYLAEMLGIQLEAGTQFALGGSLTGDMNLNSVAPSFILPGFQQQIDDVIAANGRPRVNPWSLYTVWVGANDFFAWLGSGDPDPNPMITTGVSNTIQGITDLSDAGARYVVVLNMPDLGKTPTGLSLGSQISGTLSFLCGSYNDLLNQQLDQLEQERRRLRIIRVDAFGLINHMVDNPQLYGFTNVTEDAISGLPTANPDEYLFWDGVHPTTAAHEYVADAVLQELEKEFPGLKHRGRLINNFRGRVYDSARWMNFTRHNSRWRRAG